MKHYTKIMDYDGGQIIKSCSNNICKYYLRKGDIISIGFNNLSEVINGTQTSKAEPKAEPRAKSVEKRSRTAKKAPKKDQLD